MREYFTFYRSYWEAISALPEEDRLAVFTSITAFSLDGTLPDPPLTGTPAAIFALVKPTLENARRRAARETAQGGGQQPMGNLPFTLSGITDAYPG